MVTKKNDPLKNLRDQVRKRRSAVTAKENRIKRNTGVDIRGTSEDPRRPVSVVSKYNRNQLISYLAKLDSFMSRSVGYNFVAGANKAILNKNDWNTYKLLETEYNRIGAKHFDEIAESFIPTAGITISQRDKTLVSETVSAQGDVVVRPYSPINRQPINVKDTKALQKLIADMRKKVSPSFLPEQIKTARTQLGQMLTVIGNPELNKQANGLSDKQFDVLWNYTNFATNVSGIYFIMQKQTADSSDKWYTSVVEDYASDIGELFDWAATLPSSSEDAGQGKKS